MLLLFAHLDRKAALRGQHGDPPRRLLVVEPRAGDLVPHEFFVVGVEDAVHDVLRVHTELLEVLVSERCARDKKKGRQCE